MSGSPGSKIFSTSLGEGTGIASINGDNTSAQILTVGTTGTDFAIVDNATGDHKFNLPTASAAKRGALSSADWSTFNAKEPAISVLAIAKGGTGATTAPEARATLGVQVAFNGIEPSTDFVLSYNSTARQLTITYGANAAVWINGARYLKSGVEVTTAHAATNGIWFFYYDSSGTMVVTQSVWDLQTTAQIAAVYYNATTPSLSLLYDERHPATTGMDNATHNYLHTTRGTQLVSGILLSGYTLNASGTGNVRWASSSGIIADEDLRLTVTALLVGDNKRVFYKIGAAATPRWDYADDADGFTDDGTNIYYNQNNAGTWQLTALSGILFVNYWIVATDTYTAPQLWAVMGQTTYATLALAEAATFSSEITDFGLLMNEGVVVYRVTYQQSVAYGAPGNARMVSINRIAQSVVLASSSGAITAGIVTTDTTNFSKFLTTSEVTVQQALEKLSLMRYPLIGITTTYSATLSYALFSCDSTGGTFTITLPTAVGVTGAWFNFKKVDSSANAITIDANSTETIDGSLTQVITNQWEALALISNGSNWLIH